MTAFALTLCITIVALCFPQKFTLFYKHNALRVRWLFFSYTFKNSHADAAQLPQHLHAYRQNLLKYWPVFSKRSRIDAVLSFGTSDPAVTGQLYGVLAGTLDALQIRGVKVEPDFLNETFYIDGYAVIVFTPLHLLYAIIFK